MELIPFSGSLVKRRWRRRGYNRLSSPTNRPKLLTARFGSASKRASWRLRLAPKLRLMRLASPLKLWGRFKNAYMKMMLGFANTTGTANSTNVFGGKRIPQARAAPMARSRADFENRLVIEIYKSMVASLELGYHKYMERLKNELAQKLVYKHT